MIVHFILHGETLESIAEEIKLENPEYLKEYHNQRCAREDYIYDELIPRKKLLIPTISEILEYNRKNDAPFKNTDRNPDIIFAPENLNEKYSVGIVEKEHTEAEIIDHPVFYTVSLQWVKKEENEHIFHFSKLDFYNRKESIIGDLAEESIRSLNPLEIRTNLKGEVMNVCITEETVKNFRVIKDQLSDHFPGQYAQMYIREFEYSVFNKDLFSERMKEDWFIKAWFAPVRLPFKNGRSYYQQTLDDGNIPVHISQKVELNDNPDEITLIQTLEPDEKKVFDFSGKYIFQAENGCAKNIQMSYGISRFGVKNTVRLLIDKLL
ncbi:hypothetical protein [Chryseobacterium populi]|uniref:LysM domain-containing protein n=1 Tax=Chryseobacterium populi TaxID=1144316 RepID=J3CLU8_9FLAO|nr:hypothetical protein [Chryseobacterium populi]EJL74234.1 hypothetical protein PMI13_00967 [Chryseobacterium populi]